MALFVIGDLHLSLGTDKPMDIFAGWKDYVPRLQANWQGKIAPGDTVVVAGDISWAMKLEDCDADFAFIHALPGRKILMKGNHDYWWSTRAKMDDYLQQKGFTSLTFLHNNCIVAENMALCGTRGWMFDEGESHDAKVMAREAGRLRLSLQAAEAEAPGLEKIAFLHYPPVCAYATAEEMVEMMREYGVKRCYYGHLHGHSIKNATQGRHGGILYRLISADAIQFDPMEIPPGAS